MECEVESLGDPDKEIGELIANGISPAALRNRATDLENKLKSLEAAKDELVALQEEGETAYRWEPLIRNEARP